MIFRVNRFFLTNCFSRGFPPWASPLKIYCILVKTSSQICLVEIASFIPSKKVTDQTRKNAWNFMTILKIFSMCATPLNRKLVNCLFSLVLHAPDAVLPAGTMSTPAGNCNACCDARRTIARCKSDMKRCWRQGTTPGVVIRFSRWYLSPKSVVLLRMDLRLAPWEATWGCPDGSRQLFPATNTLALNKNGSLYNWIWLIIS